MNNRREAESRAIALTCRLCGEEQSAPGLDLGLQPVSNRFKDRASDPAVCFPVELASCAACGLVQLARSAPVGEMRPRRSWMRYREREDHLDAVVETFRPFLPGTAQGSRVLGITDFDAVLARRLTVALPLDYAQLSPATDLEIAHDIFGMETFQGALTRERAVRFSQGQGKARLLISRYLLEHAQSPSALLGAFRELLDEDGFLIVEVPDAEAPLDRRDYQMIWEEHFSYFTGPTLTRALERNGFVVRSIFRASSRFEQPLLVLAQKEETACTTTATSVAGEAVRFRRFSDRFAGQKQAARDFCGHHRDAGRRVVLFGAGHFSVAAVSLFGLEEFVSFVIDDDPDKTGLFLPGSALSIVPSSRLEAREPVVILLCVNPDVEARVIEKLKTLIPDEESCYSIFAGSPRFFLHE